MRKTSVYLSDEEANRLAQLVRVTGKSQSDLIRQGIALVTAAQPRPKRIFHSRGVGHGDGTHPGRWDADELYAANVRPAVDPDS